MWMHSPITYRHWSYCLWILVVSQWNPRCSRHRCTAPHHIWTVLQLWSRQWCPHDHAVDGISPVRGTENRIWCPNSEQKMALCWMPVSLWRVLAVRPCPTVPFHARKLIRRPICLFLSSIALPSVRHDTTRPKWHVAHRLRRALQFDASESVCLRIRRAVSVDSVSTDAIVSHSRPPKSVHDNRHLWHCSFSIVPFSLNHTTNTKCKMIHTNCDCDWVNRIRVTECDDNLGTHAEILV